MLRTITVILFIISCSVHAKNTNKNVLVLWDSKNTNKEDYISSITHKKLEVVLNHYGIKAEYLDLNKVIPKFYTKTENIKEYHALISWTQDATRKNTEKVFNLFKAFKALNKKVALLGVFPLSSNPTKQKKYYQYFKDTYNFEFTDKFFDNPMVLDITHKVKDSKIIEFERSLKNEVKRAILTQSKSKKNKVLLSVTDRISNETSDLIVHNKKFFYGQIDYVLYTSPFNYTTQWRLDPYYFSSWLLDDQIGLVPDTTSLYSKRIMYSHIDGDAFINLSEIDRKSYSGEIILNEIINKYKIPISTSFVAAEVDESLLGTKRISSIIKDFFKSPHIELASHTYSHPLSWNKTPTEEELEIYKDIVKDYKGGPILAYKIPGYNDLNYNKEILESINFLNNLSPKRLKSNMIFWSGSCEPPVEAFKVLEENGLISMNGGDSRFDKRYPSLSHLYPLYRKVDTYYQPYSSNSNENTYTNLWIGPFGGFANVIETFKNTESPIRIKPINIYYHFYSGEKQSSLDALHKVYSWSLKQNILPIMTSEYINIINSFIKVNITKHNKNHYKIDNNKKLTSFRFYGDKLPDYSKSTNIIGHNKVDGVLYISANPDSNIELFLTDSNHSNYPYIIESDGHISDYSYKDNKITINFKSHYNKKITINNFGKKLIKNKDIEKINYLDKTIIIELKSKQLQTVIEVSK